MPAEIHFDGDETLVVAEEPRQVERALKRKVDLMTFKDMKGNDVYVVRSKVTFVSEKNQPEPPQMPPGRIVGGGP